MSLQGPHGHLQNIPGWHMVPTTSNTGVPEPSLMMYRIPINDLIRIL